RGVRALRRHLEPGHGVARGGQRSQGTGRGRTGRGRPAACRGAVRRAGLPVTAALTCAIRLSAMRKTAAMTATLISTVLAVTGCTPSERPSDLPDGGAGV